MNVSRLDMNSARGMIQARVQKAFKDKPESKEDVKSPRVSTPAYSYNTLRESFESQISSGNARVVLARFVEALRETYNLSETQSADEALRFAQDIGLIDKKKVTADDQTMINTLVKKYGKSQ